ncbi:uncharacterized protein MELLADRAFT_110848 [Melampsora larici-populina 98AG31]|uniref:Uncharacterized protein n=1 Tax=Melampsora larici-populina (strain 98AG31 / pathotype 3-4-7) TaxID=747676 RepID=F4S162_MELLP|nr:uncharacterized protein MELLADRAFT_110848 [Melampsora larici-populina 98AG31]EGG01622.1 hypothetical protein MELLADRAFT_110848 [Melampsora larici-populina 98AG31]
MWPLVNNIALAHQHRTVSCLGPDGSQQEGNDAEAARLTEARNLNITLFINLNNVVVVPSTSPYLYTGSTKEMDDCMVLDTMSKEDVTSKGICIDSDLEGSTGRKAIHESHPGLFIPSGIIEKRLVNCFGEIVHQASDAVDQIRLEGFHFGSVNKSTLNVIDEQAMNEHRYQKLTW